MNTRDPPSIELSDLCILVLTESTENFSAASISTVNLDSVLVSIISAFEFPSKILSVDAIETPPPPPLVPGVVSYQTSPSQTEDPVGSEF